MQAGRKLMERKPTGFKPVSCGLIFAGLSSFAVAPPLQAAPASHGSLCYHAALSFGATDQDRDRAAYLCEGATDSAPAHCYWSALSFGSNRAAKNRAAQLCRGATDLAPAQCYWNRLSIGASRKEKVYAVEDCSAQPLLTLPSEIQDCVAITRYQLRVSASSALNACSNEYYQNSGHYSGPDVGQYYGLPISPRIDLKPLLR